MKKIVTLLVLLLGCHYLGAQILPEGPMRVQVRLKKSYADASPSWINLDPYEITWQIRLLSPQGSGSAELVCLTKDVPDVPAFSDDVNILVLDQLYTSAPSYLVLQSSSWEDDCGNRCEYDVSGFPCAVLSDDDFCQDNNFRFHFRSLGPPCQWVENWVTFNCPQNGFERRNLLASYYTPPLPRSLQFLFNNREIKAACQGQLIQIRASDVFLNWPIAYQWQVRKRLWDGFRWQSWSVWEDVGTTSTPNFDYLPELAEAQRMEIQVRVRTNAGCNSEGFTESLALPIYPAPTAPVISENINICGGNRAVFEPISPGAEQVVLYNNQGFALDSAQSQPFFLAVWQTRPEATYLLSARNGNCESRKVEVVARLRPIPQTPIANDAYRCGPGSVTFTANNAIGLKLNLYASYDAQAPLVSANGITITSPAVSTNTVFFLETENEFGCKSDARMPVMALLNQAPNFQLSAADVERCGPGNLTFTVLASGPVRLFATPTGGSPIAQAVAPPYLLTTPFISISTTFYLETGQGECISFRKPAVARVSAGTYFDAGQDQTITCGSSVTLNATSGGVNYRWSPPLGLNNPTSSTTVASPAQSVTYTVTASLGGCEVSDTVRVNVEPGIINITATAQNICSGSSVELSASMQGAATFQWSPATGLNNTTGNSVVASPTVTTTYTVSVLRGGCRSSGTITVFIRPLPSLSASVAGSEVTLSAAGGTPPYVYSLGGSFQTNSTFSGVSPGTYTATVRDFYGCLANATVNVHNCPAPLNLQVTPEGIVAWSSVEGAQGYELEIKNGSNWSNPLFLTSPNYLLRGYSGVVEIRVRARCQAGLVSESAQTLWQSPETCPSVAQITVNNITNASATVTYSPVPGAIGYRVEYRQPPANWILVTTTAATSVTLTGLSPYTDYQVRVTTLCENGATAQVDRFIDFKTLLNCNPPLALSASEVTPTQARITWLEVPNAIGYMLTYQCGNSAPVAIRAGQPYLLTGLTPGSACTLRVRSICDPNLPLPDGLSPWSESITLRVPASKTSLEPNASGFQIYPNPARSGAFEVAFELEKEETVRFEIWNTTGSLIWEGQEKLKEGAQVLPFRLDLANGLYLIKVATVDTTYSARLRIE